jgi:hypothetical protein
LDQDDLSSDSLSAAAEFEGRLEWLWRSNHYYRIRFKSRAPRIVLVDPTGFDAGPGFEACAKQLDKAIDSLEDQFVGILCETLAKLRALVPNREHSPMMRDNILRLIELLPSVSPEDLFLLAELHREIGQFNETRTVLNSLPKPEPESPGDLTQYYRDQMVDLCNREFRTVIEFVPPEVKLPPPLFGRDWARRQVDWEGQVI